MSSAHGGLMLMMSSAIKDLTSTNTNWFSSGRVIQMTAMCHKRLDLPLLDTNYFSDEMVKTQSKNH